MRAHALLALRWVLAFAKDLAVATQACEWQQSQDLLEALIVEVLQICWCQTGTPLDRFRYYFLRIESKIAWRFVAAAWGL